MTEQEYFTALNYIRNSISQGDLEHVQEELEKLFSYKPVRLLWYITKAEYYIAIGSEEKVWPLLNDKFICLYDYPGMKEVRDFHINWAKMHKDQLQEIRLERYYSKLIDHINLNVPQEEIERLAKNVKENHYSYSSLSKLCSILLLNSMILEFYIILQYLCEKKQSVRDENDWFYSLPNYGYLLEQLQDSNRCFILISNNSNQQLVNVLSYVIHDLGHSIAVVVEGEENVLDNVIESESALLKSIESRYETEYAIYYTVLYYYKENGILESNIDHILKYLSWNTATDKFAILICESDMMQNLMQYSILRKNLEALAEIRNELSNNLCFAWLGDYLGYLKSVYKGDVYQSLKAPDECTFSIIIPARNAAGTLQHTLQTCLRQDYQGKYEIIISDNSQEGYNEIKSLCDDVNDSRIKYFRTPRDLQLTKSFEYAFLKARGTFILAIGGDDGLYSWSLSKLSEVLTDYPEAPIIQWKRGFYAWPGFNGGQENELIILHKKERNEYYHKNSIDYLAEILNNTQNIYSLPLLYINSGFRREYMKELLSRTGRLWDGCSQDVSIGVINAVINKTILNIDYPITIAGMSNGSMGYRSITTRGDAVDLDSETNKKLTSNVAIYCNNSYEHLIPQGKDDVCTLYWNVLRAIRIGLIPEEWLTEVLDFKKIFTEFFNQHHYTDVFFDKYLHQARYIASLRGEEFLAWFDQEIYQQAVIPRYIPHSITSTVKTYQEGKTSENNQIIDASRYSVSNIFEAVVLSEKLSNGVKE